MMTIGSLHLPGRHFAVWPANCRQYCDGAARSIAAEMGDTAADEFAALADVNYQPDNLGAAIASGSFRTAGMVVIPCSMRSLAAIATGNTGDLLTRAADVCLKERRRLPRARDRGPSARTARRLRRPVEGAGGRAEAAEQSAGRDRGREDRDGDRTGRRPRPLPWR